MAVRANASEMLQTFAFHQYKEAFATGKRVEFQEGYIGFRKGKHKVVKDSLLSWEETYEKMENSYNLAEYLRIQTSLNKTKILSDKDNEEKMTALERVGVFVVQDEYFYIKLHNSQVETTQLS